MAKVRQNQLFEGKSWHDFTDKNHLIAAYDYDITQVFNRLEQVLDVNLGENFVSMIMEHGIHYIDKGKEFYEWYLENTHAQNYELLGSYEDEAMSRAIGTTAGHRPGANRSEFYLLFQDKPFGVTEIIVGMKPDLYRLWIVDDPKNVGGDRWLYRVQLNSHSETEYIPADEILPGTFWSSDGGLVPETHSYTGSGISFRSHGMLRNTMSQFRLKHKISGNMFDIKPMGFFVKGKNNKAEMLWISNVEYEFLKQARWATASIVMNGHSNVWADGSVGNIDKNGFNAKSGSGFKEQWLVSNKHVWNTAPNMDFLNEIALDAVVGKIKFDERKMIVKAGEYGLTALSNMVMEKYGANAWTSSRPWMGDNTGRAYTWNNNEVNVKAGQVMGVATINGIQFAFVIDPGKDDLKRNKIMHPLGGPASSYEYDIMGFGSKDEKANMQIVRRSGETPIWGAEEGIRGFYNEAGSFFSPKRLSTAVDASTLHYFEPGIGAIVWDPTKIIRYYPELTQV
ncbi:MAG: hypothetical protein M0R17_04565 [Candidatus Omnitrophica bacterium]|jgi:hypothetical protein|nr:hypothetical protein [Candidatus Omnitrophota bacterium]